MEKENIFYQEIQKLPILDDKKTRDLLSQEIEFRQKSEPSKSSLTAEQRLLDAIFGREEDLPSKNESQLQIDKTQYEYQVSSLKTKTQSGYFWKKTYGPEDLSFQNEEIKNQLIEGHLNLVFNIARQCHTKYNNKYEFDDLFQEGVQALITAVHRFTPFSKNVSFINYAKACVLGRIVKFTKTEQQQHEDNFLDRILKNKAPSEIFNKTLQLIVYDLPEEEKFLICFYYDENWQRQNSYSNIATCIGKTEYWIKKKINNAKKNIREQIIFYF